MPNDDQKAAAARAGRDAKPQDTAITIGASVPASGMTEDMRRAAGVDAGADAQPHDWSPEANSGVGAGGTLIDTYSGAPAAEHPNVRGETMPLALGQAPVVPAFPMVGSRNVGETFRSDRPNAINQSPVIRGVDMDERNDPAHPEFKKADKNHPDYGRPIGQHQGVRTANITYEDVIDAEPPKGSDKGEPKPAA